MEQTKHFKRITPQQLYQAREIVIANKFDDKLLGYFNQEIERVEALQKQIKELLSVGEFQDHQLEEARVIATFARDL